MTQQEKKCYGFINREVANVGEAPFKNVISKVVTQARFAEPFTVIRQEQGWYEVTLSDTYQGWVSPAEVILAGEDFWKSYQSGPMVLITSHFAYVFSDEAGEHSPEGKDNRQLLTGVTMATMLKLLSEEGDAYRILLPDGSTGLVPKSDAEVIPAFNRISRGTAESIVSLGKEFMGLPYYWGGTTSYGFDCSGFMQTIYKMNGIHMLRDAHQQYEMGQDIPHRKDLRMADMVFFSTYREGPSHVGIYIADGRYIHSGGKGIAINSFDPADELYSEALDQKYLGARRIL
jgi:gamma-D-glutamyl-L-lysine dipeptidyl-peptidase